MNTLKKLALTGAATALTAEQSFAAIASGTVDDGLIGTTSTSVVEVAVAILN